MSGTHLDNSAPRRSTSGVRAAVCALVASLAIVTAPVAGATGPGARSTSLGVIVVVAPRAIVRSMREPSSLDVTAEDVARGFVDIADGPQLSVQSNAAEGFAIDVWPRVALFSAALVSTSDGSARISGDGGSVAQRRVAIHGLRDVQLRFRFYLNAGVAAGRYAWPVALAVRPL